MTAYQTNSESGKEANEADTEEVPVSLLFRLSLKVHLILHSRTTISLQHINKPQNTIVTFLIALGERLNH